MPATVLKVIKYDRFSRTVCIGNGDSNLVITKLTNATITCNVVKDSYLCVSNNESNTMNSVKNKARNQLVDHFKKHGKFTKNELLEYYKISEPEIKDGTLKWRIYALKKNHVIRSVARGVYTIAWKPEYKPEPDKYIVKISKLFLKRYNEINYCIWYSGWLYGFMQHQPFSSFYVFETEKEVSKEVFNLFKDEGLNAFYQPNESLIDDYVSYSKKAIIIKPIISRSPIYVLQNVKLATIEKMLVDMFCDRHLYPVFNISEQINIFENVFENYNINFSRLLNYAHRRQRKKELRDFIRAHFDNLLEEIFI